MSDRNVSDVSFATYLEDLEILVDSLKLERFALFGMSGGAAIAIAYASRHPDRVSKLVIRGGYALGRNKRPSPQSAEEAKTLLAMMKNGWGDDKSLFFRAFSSFFLPNGTIEQTKWLLDLQRAAFSPDGAVAGRSAVDDIDISEYLRSVSTPTIAFHSLRDNLVPFEQGRLIAASIPNAKLVPLESENHIILQDEPAWATMMNELADFLES